MSKQKLRESREKMSKILHGRYSRLGAFFQKEMLIPGKIANRPKFLDLVNYQHSQNLQNLSTRVNNKTLSQQGLGTKPGVCHGVYHGLPVVNKVKKKNG